MSLNLESYDAIQRLPVLRLIHQRAEPALFLFQQILWGTKLDLDVGTLLSEEKFMGGKIELTIRPASRTIYVDRDKHEAL